MMCKNVAANIGPTSTGPSPRACKRNRMPPDRATRSMSMRTSIFRSVAGNSSKNNHAPISARVCTQTGRNGSSACSATATNARMMGSERGMVFVPAMPRRSRGSEAISTIARMSLMTCSLSIACLLSRARDLFRKCEIPIEQDITNTILHNEPLQGLFMQLLC